MIEKLFPQIYTYNGKKYKTIIYRSQTDTDTLEVVINGIEKNTVFYQTIDDNGNNTDGIVFYKTEEEFNKKFKKLTNDE